VLRRAARFSSRRR